MEIDDVLVARMASGLEEGAELGENLALHRLVLGDRFDHQVGVAERFEAMRPAPIRPSAACAGRLG